MDGLECKRCKEPDTFEDLCEDCDAIVYARTDRLIRRSRKAKIEAEELCTQLSPEGIAFFHKMLEDKRVGGEDGSIDPDELLAEWSRSGFDDWQDRYRMSMRLLQLAEQYDGYSELATMSRRIPTDDNYLAGEIESTTNYKWVQRWENQ